MDLPVIIEKIIFRSDKGFSILACSLNPYSSKYQPEMEDIVTKNIKPNSYNNFAVTMNMLESHVKMEGRQYIFTGNFIKHERYGEQFKADFGYQDHPTTNDGMIAYLCTLPNIGPVRSTQIIKKFGLAEIERIMEEEPNELTKINGITEARVSPIKQAWDRDKALRELYMWLNEHSISPILAKRIYNTWGLESFKILTTNPYKLIEIPHIGFMRADEVAHKIFKNVPKDVRTVACMRYVLDENLHKNSNLCMLYSSLIEASIEELRKGTEKNNVGVEFDEKEYRRLIPQCIKNNLNIFVAVKNTVVDNCPVFVYLKSIWDKEKYVATSIYHRSKNEPVQKETDDDNPNAQKENRHKQIQLEVESVISKYS